MSENKHWYVLRAIFKQEQKVRDYLRRQGLRCYVPMCWQKTDIGGRQIRRLVPAINELVFVYGHSEEISQLKSRCRETVYWLTTQKEGHREKLIVEEKAMDDFIRVTEQKEHRVVYYKPNEISLHHGDRIRIHGGNLDGVEGILLKVKGRREKQLVVSIPNLAIASVSIRPELIEVIDLKRQKSHDALHDSRELIRLSTQMLTAPPDKTANAEEWHLLFAEIQRLYDSLKNLHGFIISREADIALALLMAEKAINLRDINTEKRFNKALNSLKDGTIQKMRMQLIGGILLEDVQMWNNVINIVSKWPKTVLSEAQRKITEECEIWQFYQKNSC